MLASESTPEARRSRVLIADDRESIRSLFHRLLSADGHDVVLAPDGASALAAVHRHRPDVVLLDVAMPLVDGLEVCRQLKADPATRLTPVVLVSGQTELTDRINGIEAGADDYLSKPVHPHELRARVRSLSRVKQLIDALDSAEAAFVALAQTIEARDPYTMGHCERLSRTAVSLGRALGLGSDDLHALHRGGYLHDIGKVGVPDSVLLKPAPLTAEESALMRRHPEIGDSLCAPLQSLRSVRPIILGHHERIDGSGYPNGLRGDNVPLLAQIVGIVDVYDALTSRRPYRDALSHDEAVRFMMEETHAGRFNPRYVDAFLETLVPAVVPALP
ncbi:MAG TPA: HD domain-containing phosphohydrolase [Vicinamibacterales bacterium]|nr:HD domain-containing phosphohydrolase [Vicinamibacterales bacterium]